ncbi:MAG: 50S ribosomal protein L24 [Gammaproteobacteria bacterium]|nr:50S ribosomal protein L24 [Gammaproteobacteria bacterium]
MRRIKKGDDVIVITGKDKGKRGTVAKVYADDRVLVDTINMAKKHVKANPQRNVQGGIVEKEMPLHISNVAIFNPTTKKADRIGIKTLEDGQKVRFFKSNNEVVDI